MIAAAKPQRPARPNALHSAKTCEHGSPVAAVELARYALGGIDLDPCSNGYWNERVAGRAVNVRTPPAPRALAADLEVV